MSLASLLPRRTEPTFLFALVDLLPDLILRDSSCLAFGRHTLGGGASPRGVGINLGFTQRGLRPVGGFFFVEIGGNILEGQLPDPRRRIVTQASQ